ncbi:MAG: hypothetical protein O2816_14295, partial [Planctomycetota bacterium]|nr:hypothetical protein [Planctomycetota bacterium]
MKTSLLLIAIVSGGLAGVGTSLIVQPGEDAGADLRAAPGPGGASVAHVAELRKTNSLLEQRLNRLESQINMVGSRTNASDAQPTQVDFDISAIEAMLAALNKPDQPAPAGLQTMVDRAIEGREERERLAKEAEDLANREERLDERMDEISEKLGLDITQRGAVRDALWDRDEARNAMFGQMRGGGGGMDREAMGTMFEEINTKATAALQSTLSPAQYEMYQEEYPDRRGGGGFGGGRGGG